MAQMASAQISAISMPATRSRRGAERRKSDSEIVGEGCASPPW